MEKFQIPNKILEITEKLQKAGFEAYLVGGCVRDLLMKAIYGEPVEPKDWDITTSAKPEQIQKLFSKTVYENKFGTVGVFTESEKESLKTVEITPFRLETKYSDKRHPDSVRFSDKLEKDLERRDFTVNSIAMELTGFKLQASSYKLIDLFGGQKDIKNKIIKTVGNPIERFNEDALRIMRAIRLAAELNFDIEAKTEQAIKKSAGLLEIISKERIRDELIKILMSDKSARALEKMREWGMLKFVLSELEEGWGITQNKHHIYTVWEHNIRALTHAISKNWPLDIRLASLLHDIGKPTAKRGEGPDSTFYGHEVIGAKMTAQIMRRLRFPAKFSEKVVKLVRWHLFFSDTEKITLSAVRRIIRNVGQENIWDLMKIRFSDRVGMGRPKEETYRLRKYEAMIEEALHDPISVKMLSIKGEDIMRIADIKQSPKVGWFLNVLFDEALDEPKLNTKEYLEKRIKELSGLSDKDLEEISQKARKRIFFEEEKQVGKIYGKYHVK